MTDAINSGNLELAHVDSSSGGGIAPLAPFLMWLLVCRDIERDEEDQIRAEDTAACDSGKFFSSAFTGIWHPLKVC